MEYWNSISTKSFSKQLIQTVSRYWSKTIKTYEYAVLSMCLLLGYFGQDFAPTTHPLYICTNQNVRKTLNLPLLYCFINNIKWHIGHSDYLGVRSIVLSEYWADTINKYCYHSFLSYFPCAVEQNIWVIFQMHTNHYFPFPTKRSLYLFFKFIPACRYQV